MPVSGSLKIQKPLLFRQFLRQFALIVGALLLPAIAVAADRVIKTVDLKLDNDHYSLSARIDYHLTDTAHDALEKGIPLFWNVRIKLARQREWLWDDVLVDMKIRYRIQYQALLNRYRVTNINTQESDSFATLSAALMHMTVIRDLTLVGKDIIKPEERYQIGLKIEFDREALPLPLRPVSYVNPQWYLSSAWYLWPVHQ